MPVGEGHVGADPRARLEQFGESWEKVLAELESVEDAAQRVQILTAAVSVLDDLGERAGRSRLEAVAELRRRGWSYQRISLRTGLSKSRVAQLSRAVDQGGPAGGPAV